jgi:hypothetical protein
MVWVCWIRFWRAPYSINKIYILQKYKRHAPYFNARHSVRLENETKNTRVWKVDYPRNKCSVVTRDGNGARLFYYYSQCQPTNFTVQLHKTLNWQRKVLQKRDATPGHFFCKTMQPPFLVYVKGSCINEGCYTQSNWTRAEIHTLPNLLKNCIYTNPRRSVPPCRTPNI